MLNCPCWLQLPKVVITLSMDLQIHSVWCYSCHYKSVLCLSSLHEAEQITFPRKIFFSYKALPRFTVCFMLPCIVIKESRQYVHKLASFCIKPTSFLPVQLHTWQHSGLLHTTTQLTVHRPTHSYYPTQDSWSSAHPHTDASMHINMLPEYKYSPHIDLCKCFINS